MSEPSYQWGRSAGTACVARGPSDKGGRKVCRVVLGLGQSAFAVRAAELLRAAGWDVQTAVAGEEARRLAVRSRANVVVLPAADDDDGGLLATAKLVTAAPRKARVVVVAPAPSEPVEQLCEFVGAGFVAEPEGAGQLVRAVIGKGLPCGV